MNPLLVAGCSGLHGHRTVRAREMWAGHRLSLPFADERTEAWRDRAMSSRSHSQQGACQGWPHGRLGPSACEPPGMAPRTGRTSRGGHSGAAATGIGLSDGAQSSAWPTIPLLDIPPRDSRTYVHTNIYGRIIHNSRRVGITQMSQLMNR